MELKQILRIFWQQRRWLVLSTLGGAGLGLLVVAWWPTAYQASLDLYVKRQTSPSSDKFYSFDGYYSQQAAERYTQTVIGFLRSREVLKMAVEELKLPVDQEALDKFSRMVKVKEAAPQLATLTVRGEDKGLVGDLILSLARTTTDKLSALNKSGDALLSIDLVAAAPLLEVSEFPLWWGAVIGSLLGFLLMVVWVSLRFYLCS